MLLNILLTLHFYDFSLETIGLIQFLTISRSALTFEGSFVVFGGRIRMRRRASELLMESQRGGKQRTVAGEKMLTEHYYIS